MQSSRVAEEQSRRNEPPLQLRNSATLQLAFIGGIYSNYHALVATLDDIARRGVDATYFLGDLGAFGPYPDRVPELLIERRIEGIQGNYEESLSTRATDCHCGYTDPRDNHYAQISYDYTFANTSDDHKRWMGTLPREIRFIAGDRKFLLVHGSPRKINEFLWRSTSPEPFLDKLLRDHDADVIVCTHTGLHWHRALDRNRHVINAGVIGRPANDGHTNVWYTLVRVSNDHVEVEFVPVAYDHHALADEMRRERLPDEFVETILTGWWTTCLEILPAKERAAGKW
ncbi:MAG TPA: metallophosphoesterase family protein [Thermoanaerobaculia bacterium]|nr:metallophosphoesterase family protein [Thermoanaerobaculia bacterium]